MFNTHGRFLWLFSDIQVTVKSGLGVLRMLLEWDDLVTVQFDDPLLEVAHYGLLHVFVALFEDGLYVESDELYPHVAHHAFGCPFEHYLS